MSFRPRTLERAYELAAGGSCRGVVDIKRCLRAEGFMDIDDQLYGMTTARALKQLCNENHQGALQVAADGEPSGFQAQLPKMTARA